MATTHYSEIKAYAMNAEGFENASMEFDAQSLRPTYRLIMGVAGSSNAFLISKRLGLKTPVIEKAKSFMRDERLEFDSLILQAERTRKGSRTGAFKGQADAGACKEVDSRAKQLEKELADKRKSAIERAKKDALEIVKKPRKRRKALSKRPGSSPAKVRARRPKPPRRCAGRFRRKKEVLKKNTEPKRRPAAPVDPAKLSLGDSVHIYSLG